nr:MAG TPA: hypothetical protein [Caudoviricetes sp.]
MEYPHRNYSCGGIGDFMWIDSRTQYLRDKTTWDSIT